MFESCIWWAVLMVNNLLIQLLMLYDDWFLLFVEHKSTCQLRPSSHLVGEARDFTLNLAGLSSSLKWTSAMRGERREERRGEEDMTCGNLAALLGHTGGDWSLQHNGDNANVGPTGWNKDRGVKYKAALHCHDRPWQSNNAREYITILQYYMLYNVTKLHHH